MIVEPQIFSEDVAALEAMLRKHSNTRQENENLISRQLLLVAAMARQALDYLQNEGSDSSTRERECGEYGETTPGEQPRQRPLTCYRACCAIIHAGKIPGYELDSKEDPALITIHGLREVRGAILTTRADLYGMAFVASCKMISSVVARHNGGAVQDHNQVYSASTWQKETDMAEQGKGSADEARNIYIYDFDRNNSCMEVGATRDLYAREAELMRKYPGNFRFIEPMVAGLLTRAEAERELKELERIGYPVNMDTLKDL